MIPRPSLPLVMKVLSICSAASKSAITPSRRAAQRGCSRGAAQHQFGFISHRQRGATLEIEGAQRTVPAARCPDRTRRSGCWQCPGRYRCRETAGNDETARPQDLRPANHRGGFRRCLLHPAVGVELLESSHRNRGASLKPSTGVNPNGREFRHPRRPSRPRPRSALLLSPAAWSPTSPWP